MEQITSTTAGQAGWLASAAGASAVAPVRPTYVTQASAPTTGQDARGGESQGRGKEESDAYRPSTFQAVLLSSTTLSNLQDVLARLSSGRSFAVIDQGSTAYQQATAQAVQVQKTEAKTSSSTESSGRGAEDRPSFSQEGESQGYYGYDWLGSGQMLDAARKATAAYLQSLNASASPADRPYAQKAEVLDLVA